MSTYRQRLYASGLTRKQIVAMRQSAYFKQIGWGKKIGRKTVY